MCMEMGSLLEERRSMSFWEGAIFAAPKFRKDELAIMHCTDKGIGTSWTPYTLCHFNAMKTTYGKYTQDNCKCRLLQYIVP
jgi:hypothetical protein